MVGGINSDVRHAGKVYHVQTEDLAAREPALLTVVFQGGQVLEKIESRYDTAGAHSSEEVRRRLVAQHRKVVDGILRGRYGSVPVRGEADPPELIVCDLAEPSAGERASFLILLRGSASYRPICDARLVASLGEASGEEAILHEGSTDVRGFHLAEFEIPSAVGSGASLILQAFSARGGAKVTLPILVPAPAPLSSSAPPQGRPELIISELDEPCAGARASFLILLRSVPDGRPIPGAPVSALYPAGSADAATQYEGTTDARGFLLAEFAIPRSDLPEAALMIQARHGAAVAEVIIPVIAG